MSPGNRDCRGSSLKTEHVRYSLVTLYRKCMPGVGLARHRAEGSLQRERRLPHGLRQCRDRKDGTRECRRGVRTVLAGLALQVVLTGRTGIAPNYGAVDRRDRRGSGRHADLAIAPVPCRRPIAVCAGCGTCPTASSTPGSSLVAAPSTSRKCRCVRVTSMRPMSMVCSTSIREPRVCSSLNRPCRRYGSRAYRTPDVGRLLEALRAFLREHWEHWTEREYGLSAWRARMSSNRGCSSRISRRQLPRAWHIRSTTSGDLVVFERDETKSWEERGTLRQQDGHGMGQVSTAAVRCLAFDIAWPGGVPMAHVNVGLEERGCTRGVPDGPCSGVPSIILGLSHETGGKPGYRAFGFMVTPSCGDRVPFRRSDRIID